MRKTGVNLKKLTVSLLKLYDEQQQLEYQLKDAEISGYVPHIIDERQVRTELKRVKCRIKEIKAKIKGAVGQYNWLMRLLRQKIRLQRVLDREPAGAAGFRLQFEASKKLEQVESWISSIIS